MKERSSNERRARWGLVAVLGLSAAACGETKATSGTYARERLLDPETCNECHKGHYDEWSGSMHAYSSVDPIFRAMNQRGQEETHGELGNFCVKCHAPMAVNEGRTEDGLNLDTLPRALQGVTCYFCHNVVAVTDTHNNPLVLANDTTMRGNISDPITYRAHRAESSPFFANDDLKSSKMCGACHDIVVPAHFSGATTDGGVPLEQTYAEWTTSVFAGPNTKAQLTCIGCHMNSEGDAAIADPPAARSRPRHSHEFWGVDTALDTVRVPAVADAGGPEGEFPNRKAQRAVIAGRLATTLRIQICVAEPFSDISVTLENLAAGHRFPSGASQDRRLWLELHVFDANGNDAYQSGVVPFGKSVVETASKDPNLWLLRDVTTKADGTPAHMFWDVAKIAPNTIPVSTPDNVFSDFETVPYSRVSTGVERASRVQAILWLEPVGVDVLDDLVATGHLEERHRNAMSRVPLVPPNPADSSTSSTLEWTREAHGEDTGHSGCAQTAKPRM